MSQLSPTERAWATGLVVFAAAMMLVSGIFQAIQGLVALVNDEFYVVGRKYTFQFDVTTWGWIHLLLGIGVAVVGAFLYMGANWARWTAIVLVGISMLTNFAWLPYYPIWGLVVLALDVAVVWALAAMD
jgi:hypothetical protein